MICHGTKVLDQLTTELNVNTLRTMFDRMCLWKCQSGLTNTLEIKRLKSNNHSHVLAQSWTITN